MIIRKNTLHRLKFVWKGTDNGCYECSDCVKELCNQIIGKVLFLASSPCTRRPATPGVESHTLHTSISAVSWTPNTEKKRMLMQHDRQHWSCGVAAARCGTWRRSEHAERTTSVRCVQTLTPGLFHCVYHLIRNGGRLRDSMLLAEAFGWIRNQSMNYFSWMV